MNMEQLLQTFLGESRDLLEEMERHLLDIRAGQCGDDAVNAIFRAAHTIKGSGGLFDLTELVQFTHVVESVLDLVRDGSLALDHDLVALLLACCDHIHLLVEAAAGAPAPDPAQAAPLLARLEVHLHATHAPDGVASADAPMADSGLWRISYHPHPTALRFGNSPLRVLRCLKALGTLEQVRTRTDGVPPLELLEPETCYLGFEIELRTDAGRARIEEVFEFVRDECELLIAPVVEGATAAAATPLPPPAIDDGEPPAAAGESGTGVQASARGARQESRSIRVDADRLDRMIDLVGELIIAVAGSNASAQRSGDAALQESTSMVAELVEQVRESALQLRMVKIGGTFSRFHRVVHDVARELGKDIALVVSGEDTELDKSVVEKIADPLTHLVRNAMDHGIEPAAVRRACGKPERGTVRLNAFHDSGSIVIEISDDGGGLDRERILAKAVERGLIDPARTLTDAEVFALVFEPGFSTAEKVTNLSGRGVGMDVVRRNISALRGSVDIASRPGIGTTISVRLPLTLAIINGFQVGVGKSVFILPLDVVEECIEFSSGYQAEYTDLRGGVLPYLRLRSAFGIDGTPPPRESIVVVKHGPQRCGIVVDQLLGEWQTVIKPLSSVFSGVRGISGSSILGSGEVALILDVGSLLRSDEPDAPLAA